MFRQYFDHECTWKASRAALNSISTFVLRQISIQVICVKILQTNRQSHNDATYRHSNEWDWRCVLETTLCDKVCQWLATGRWFSPDTPVSSTNKTDRNDITEMLLKVALNTITLTLTRYWRVNWWMTFTLDNSFLFILHICNYNTWQDGRFHFIDEVSKHQIWKCDHN